VTRSPSRTRIPSKASARVRTRHDIEYRKFYIDGQWVDPAVSQRLQSDHPAQRARGLHSMGVRRIEPRGRARRRAFDTFSQTTRENARAAGDILKISRSVTRCRQRDPRRMGAPATLANGAQAASVLDIISAMLDVLRDVRISKSAEEQHGSVGAVGVCALITP